jgi:hypothetical protein
MSAANFGLCIFLGILILCTTCTTTSILLIMRELQKTAYELMCIRQILQTRAASEGEPGEEG